MMKGYFLLLAAMLASSCDRSDYVIDIQHAYIEHVSENGGSGYIVIAKEGADHIERYGDVYVEAKFCPSEACKPVTIGGINKYDQEPVDGGIKLKLELSDDLLPHGHPKFWLKNVACIKLNAVQGFMGRAGRSDWNCSVAFSDENAEAR